MLLVLFGICQVGADFAPKIESKLSETNASATQNKLQVRKTLNLLFDNLCSGKLQDPGMFTFLFEVFSTLYVV